MPQTLWEVPNFELSGFYYPEIIEDLIRFNQETPGEITETDPRDPFVQIMRSFALATHYSNVRIDVVANEAIFGSATLRESIRQHLKLIGQTLKQLTPAKATLIARVTNRFTSNYDELIPPLSIFTTVAGEVVDDFIEYECIDGLDLSLRNDKVGHVFDYQSPDYTDDTTQAQAGTPFGVWGAGLPGSMLYIGHPDVMFDQVAIDIVTQAYGHIHGVWETFRSDLFQGTPDTVEVDGDVLKFKIDGMLGTTKNRAGTTVRVMSNQGTYQDLVSTYRSGMPQSVTVTASLKFNINSLFPEDSPAQDRSGTSVIVRCIETRVSKTLVSTWDALNLRNEIQTSLLDDPLLGQAPASALTTAYWCDIGPNMIETSGESAFLGQQSPSEVPGDYIAGTQWREITEESDTVDDFFLASGGDSTKLKFTLPMNANETWDKTEINGVTGYWLRYRVIASQSMLVPELGKIDINDSDQFVAFDVVQGKTVEDSPLDSHSGEPDYQMALGQAPVLDESIKLFIDEGVKEYEYVKAKNWLNSTAYDRHFVVEVDEIGQGIIQTGGTIGGKVPPSGVDNARAEYRICPDVDGNVGANAITANSEGVAYIDRVTNPKGASGYIAREGDSEDDLLRVKENKPAALEYGSTAGSPKSIEYHAINTYVAEDGTSPIVRAKAVELGGTSKQTLLYVLASGGQPLSSDALEHIDDFFNGNEDKKIQGIMTSNQKVVTQNAILIPVNVGVVHTGGSEASILAALNGVLIATAKDEDSGDFLWNFGSKVSAAQIVDVLMDSSPKPSNVLLRRAGTGTVSASGGTYAVTGAGTAFTTEANAGDKVLVDGTPYVYTIASIQGNGDLTTTEQIAGGLSGMSFTLLKGDLQLQAYELPTKGELFI